jgi:hypothetical protein
MPYVVAAGRLAQQAMKRVVAAQLVVAVGQYQDRGQAGNSPDEETQRVKRRLVCPVNVLDDHNGRMIGPGQFGPQGGEHPVAVAAIQQGAAELCSDAAHKIAERAKGPRGRQIVAVAHEHPGLGGKMGAHRLDQV